MSVINESFFCYVKIFCLKIKPKIFGMGSTEPCVFSDFRKVLKVPKRFNKVIVVLKHLLQKNPTL